MSGEDEWDEDRGEIHAVRLTNGNGGETWFGPMTQREAFDFAGGARALWKLSAYWEGSVAWVGELAAPTLEEARLRGFVPTVVVDKEPVA